MQEFLRKPLLYPTNIGSILRSGINNLTKNPLTAMEAKTCGFSMDWAPCWARYPIRLYMLARTSATACMATDIAL